MTDAEVLHFDGAGEVFEQRSMTNGTKWWLATDLARMLGYESFQGFQNTIRKAIGTLLTLQIPVEENIRQHNHVVDGHEIRDYKLSRFGCYLVALNADPKKPQVARAQGYFAGLADAQRQYVESVDDVERVLVRDEISDRERSLNAVAHMAGVDNFAYFQNAGYRGMYNMDLGELKRRKGMVDPRRSLLDFMGKRELAGNLFRITETEARLKSSGTRGQRPAEAVAHQVGSRVRDLMMENGGTAPERLALDTDIKEVRRGLKRTAKDLRRLDQPGATRKMLPPPPNPVATPAPPKLTPQQEAWQRVVDEVLRRKPTLGAVLHQGIHLGELLGQELELVVTGNLFHLEMMRDTENIQVVTTAVRRHFTGAARIRVSLSIHPAEPPEE